MDHGKNYINVRPLLVRHLLRNRLSKANVKYIYPSELNVVKANRLDDQANYLDLKYIIGNNNKRPYTELYDKRDNFDLHIVNSPFLSNNIPSGPSYGAYILQLIRYARCCNITMTLDIVIN